MLLLVAEPREAAVSTEQIKLKLTRGYTNRSRVFLLSQVKANKRKKKESTRHDAMGILVWDFIRLFSWCSSGISLVRKAGLAWLLTRRDKTLAGISAEENVWADLWHSCWQVPIMTNVVTPLRAASVCVGVTPGFSCAGLPLLAPVIYDFLKNKQTTRGLQVPSNI